MSSMKLGSCYWITSSIIAVPKAAAVSCLMQRFLRNSLLPHRFPSISCRNFVCPAASSSSSFLEDSDLQDVMLSYVLGKKRATEAVHYVWKSVIREGDTVIDATCGNGHDTLALLKMVSGKSGSGRVYSMDIQKEALETTSRLLENSLLNQKQNEVVKLFPICHSEMEDIVPESCPVRLVAFNLGYLPGGDKAITTKSETTLQALKAAERILVPGGLISLVVYVGHPGGPEELEAVESFSRGLSAEKWICCKLEMLNRPSAPMPVFLFKR